MPRLNFMKCPTWALQFLEFLSQEISPKQIWIQNASWILLTKLLLCCKITCFMSTAGITLCTSYCQFGKFTCNKLYMLGVNYAVHHETRTLLSSNVVWIEQEFPVSSCEWTDSELYVLRMIFIFLLWGFLPFSTAELKFNGNGYDNVLIGLSTDLVHQTTEDIEKLLEPIKVSEYIWCDALAS